MTDTGFIENEERRALGKAVAGTHAKEGKE